MSCLRIGIGTECISIEFYGNAICRNKKVVQRDGTQGICDANLRSGGTWYESGLLWLVESVHIAGRWLRYFSTTCYFITITSEGKNYKRAYKPVDDIGQVLVLVCNIQVVLRQSSRLLLMANFDSKKKTWPKHIFQS